LVKIPNSANDDLLNKTLAVWRPRSRWELNREDAREIAEDIDSFVSNDWSCVESARPASDAYRRGA
jgi:hypothetical protein